MPSIQQIRILLITFSIALIELSILLHKKLTQKWNAKFGKNSSSGLPPPLVEDFAPLFIGHASKIYKAPIEFLSSAYNKYGPIFKIKFGHKKILVLCDKTPGQEHFQLKVDFWKLLKKNMTFTGGCSIDNGLLLDIFLDSQKNLNQIHERKIFNPAVFNELLVKHTNSSYSTLALDIEETTMDSIRRLKTLSQAGNTCDSFQRELHRYVLSASSFSLFGFKVDDAFFIEFEILAREIKSILLNSFFLSNFTMSKYIKWKLYGQREQTANVQVLASTINKYMLNPKFEQNRFGRLLANKISMTEVEFRYFTLLILYLSTDATFAALKNVIIELAQNSDEWKKLRSELLHYIKPSAGYNDKIIDMDGLLNSKHLQAVIVESMRLNTNTVVGVSQIHELDYKSFSKYDISSADMIALLNSRPFEGYGSGSGKDNNGDEENENEDLLKFNPGRYLINNDDENNDGTKRDLLQTSAALEFHLPWEDDLYKYPQKLFGLNIIKIYVSLLVVNVDIKLKHVSESNHVTTHAFKEKQFDAKLIPYFAWM